MRKGHILNNMLIDHILGEIKDLSFIEQVLLYQEEDTHIFTFVINEDQLDLSSLFCTLYLTIFNVLEDQSISFDFEYVHMDQVAHYALPEHTSILFDRSLLVAM